MKPSTSNRPTQPIAYEREPGYANRYRDIRFQTGTGAGTHRREVRVLESLLTPLRPSGLWLDAPSGAGRFTEFLAAAGVDGVVQLDRNHEMLRACGTAAPRVCADATELPFADNSFDGVLCMRLLQHAADAATRIAVLRELARVCRGAVVFSFFHSWSLQHVRRLIAGWTYKRPSRRHSTPLAEMKRNLHAAGLELRSWRGLAPGVSEQWIGVATKASATAASELPDPNR